MIQAGRIDLHHHMVPPFWAEQLPEHGGDPSGWLMPQWSPEGDLAQMDSLGIEKSILSLTTPAVCGWHGQAQLDMARRVNDYAAMLREKYANRFGLFATLPLETIEAAIAEMTYAVDALKADGIMLLSSYDGVYLGDARFNDLWAEIARRDILVFIHPTMPKIDLVPGLPGPMLDFPYDTSRAALSIIAHGVLTRHPSLRIILSHAGGFLPFGAHRFAGSIAGSQPERTAASIIAEMQRFYFDTALSSGPTALPCLLSFAATGHIVFGSDIPYARTSRVAWFTRALDDHFKDDPEGLQVINRTSAVALLGKAVSGSVMSATSASV